MCGAMRDGAERASVRADVGSRLKNGEKGAARWVGVLKGRGVAGRTTAMRYVVLGGYSDVSFANAGEVRSGKPGSGAEPRGYARRGERVRQRWEGWSAGGRRLGRWHRRAAEKLGLIASLPWLCGP